MTIDSFYENVDKNNFYIGRISQVYRENSIAQVENLSLLGYKKIYNEIFVPNTINYLVVIDSCRGIFIGEVFQNKVTSSKLHDTITSGNLETISPEINIDVIGVMTYKDKTFKLPEFMTVGISDKVYLANQKVLQKYLESLEIIQSSEDKLKPFATCLNMDAVEIALKPSTLFNHHLFVVGATNSGKSTSALSILDKVINENKKALIIDPTGEYKEAFFEDSVTKLHLGSDTLISPGKLSMEHWSMLFEANSNTQSVVLSEAIQSLRYQYRQDENGCYVKNGKNILSVQKQLSTLEKSDADFDIELLANQIIEESVVESKSNTYCYDIFKKNTNGYLYQKVKYQLDNNDFLSFFRCDSNKKNLLDEIDKFTSSVSGSLYINTSLLGASTGIGGMIIDLICHHIISQNISYPFVFFIDEVHRYTKSHSVEEEKFYNGLTLVSREGRKKGIFLFLTSQNPQDVSPILLGQIGTLLIHRLMHNDEIKSIRNHLNDYTIAQVKKLNQGEAILTSVNLLQDIFIHMKKANRCQFNDTPIL